MKPRTILVLAFLALLLVAVAFRGRQVFQRHRLEQCLPDGVHLTDSALSGPLVCDSLGRQVVGLLTGRQVCGKPRLGTIEEELHRLGAFPKDGLLHCAEGEIAFHSDDPRKDYEPWMYEGKIVIVVLPAGHSE
jgi:hypothetical protein